MTNQDGEDGGTESQGADSQGAGSEEAGGKQGGSKQGGRPALLSDEARGEESRELALAIANVALQLKALKVEIIDVRGKVDYSDFVVVMSGRSDRQVAALARNIEQTLQGRGVRCIGVEGMPQATWLLMDYGDVIVHIFHQDTRGYYDLETLWIDAARVTLDEDAQEHDDRVDLPSSDHPLE